MNWWKPEDIREIDFNRSFRGYNEEEVRDFLEELASQIESMVAEREKILQDNRELKKRLKDKEGKLSNLEAQIEEWEKQIQVERELAKRESQMVLKEAEIRGQEIVEEALKRKKEIEKGYQALLEQYRLFQIRFRSLLQTFMDSLEWKEKDWDAKALEESKGVKEEEKEEGGEIARFSIQDFQNDNRLRKS
ncbi:MAG: cell division initiation protein [Candidatus Atribacteria bacterium]|nr:cell division initiation protein [Candidatus Atribacteria bacterium]